MRELGNGFNMSASLRKSCKDFQDVCSILHRNDSELILFIYPNEECFAVVVEDSSAIRPFSVETASLQESVTFLK